ncbi:MAG: RNA methyltransferase [Pyrinomonas methylaliphatogenes]|nr:RNA methyltransferase [Pyrinomonas methylaliphatogenes]
MHFKLITSRNNERLKLARAVRDGRERDLIFIEGARLCEEALRSETRIEELLVAESTLADERIAKLIAKLRARGPQMRIVRDDIFASVADTATPQGIILLARRPQTDRHEFERCLAARNEARSDVPLIVILHRLNNPLNAGAIARTSEAAGAIGLIATQGTTDLLSPKALRGAMGSSLRLPIWTGARLDEALAWCRTHAIRTVALDPRAEVSHTEFDWRAPCAILLGAEAEGLSADERRATDERVRIPMRPPVESLNVAVAAGIVLYEAVRQRGFGSELPSSRALRLE